LGADQSTDSESVGFSLIFFGRAKLHVPHSKNENHCGEWDMIRLQNSRNLLIINDLAERVGFERTIERTLKTLGGTGGTVSHPMREDVKKKIFPLPSGETWMW
jgi:hypothetical protein